MAAQQSLAARLLRSSQLAALDADPPPVVVRRAKHTRHGACALARAGPGHPSRASLFSSNILHRLCAGKQRKRITTKVDGFLSRIRPGCHVKYFLLAGCLAILAQTSAGRRFRHTMRSTPLGGQMLYRWAMMMSSMPSVLGNARLMAKSKKEACCLIASLRM